MSIDDFLLTVNEENSYKKNSQSRKVRKNISDGTFSTFWLSSSIATYTGYCYIPLVH